MKIISLGYQTDFALLKLGNSEIEDRGDYLVIRTPHNPTFWWGNFLFLPGPPDPADTDLWIDRFRAEFPDAKHLALGFDGIDGSIDDLSGFTAKKLNVEEASVMTATSVHAPPRPNTDAVYRALENDEDWAQRVQLGVDCRDDDQEEEEHRVFMTAKAATMRGLTEAGHGKWFGAFVDGRMVSSMGLFRASEGLCRFQSVETHPEFRGRGLAGTLVHEVSKYGFGELGAHTLVMVADPTYLAIRVYRSVGFEHTETQLQVEER